MLATDFWLLTSGYELLIGTDYPKVFTKTFTSLLKFRKLRGLSNPSPREHSATTTVATRAVWIIAVTVFYGE